MKLNLFNKAREYLCYSLHGEKPQKFISYWKPDIKIGAVVWWIDKDYNYETKKYHNYKTKKVKVNGYKFTFTVDITGNIAGECDYETDAYNFNKNEDFYISEKKATKALAVILDDTKCI